MAADSQSPAPAQRVRRPLRGSSQIESVFTDAVTARHVAEHLHTCKLTDLMREAAAVMSARGFDVLGVEGERGVVGYVEKQDEVDGAVDQHVKVFHTSDLVTDSTPLVDLLERLSEWPRTFVLTRKGVTEIATRADLQKAPVRLYMFGLITLFEMTLTREIRQSHPDGDWETWVSPQSLAAARRLLSVRKKRNEEIDLLECLNLGAKCTVATKSPLLSPRLPFSGSDEAIGALRAIEKLRNRLAHGQDLISGSSWEEVMQTVRLVTGLLARLEEPRGAEESAVP